MLKANDYLREYNSNYQIKSFSDFDKEANSALLNAKRYWKKEVVPEKILFLISMKQTAYEPQSYLNGLVRSDQKSQHLLPYMALYQIAQGEAFSVLQNAVYHSNRLAVQHLQPLASGYDHCIGFVHVLNALAAADFDCIAKLFPLENGASQNGKTSLRIFTNLFMGLWYENSELINQSYDDAAKFLLTKAITKQESLVVKYLMALVDRNIESLDELLLSICQSVSNDKGDSLIPFRRPLGSYFTPEIHGFVNLAYFIFGDELRDYLADFDGPYYCKEYTDFLFEHRFAKPKACFTYQNELSVVNTLLTRLPTTYTYKDGNKTFTDTERYRKDRLKLVEERLDLERHFIFYNR